MRIYTIFTGGTIGSRKDDVGIIKPGDTPFRLIDFYLHKYGAEGQNVEFIADEPYRILSENLSAKEVIMLINAVNRAIEMKEIDGIIITHGTDTLQYTSAILGYVFAEVKLPIVIVSSNYVLDDKRGNGLCNFRFAVDFIKSLQGTGVFVAYQNTGECCKIHRATRLQDSVLLSDNVSSVMDSWYGRYVKNNVNGYEFERNPDYIECLSESEDVENIAFDRFNIRLSDTSKEILRIVPYVGMHYPDISEDVKVVLHESYHSGTIRISRELEVFALQAKQRDIPIFLTGLNHQEAEYETVSKYRAYGIIPLPECAVIAQYCKLWLAISNDKDIMKTMCNPLGGDKPCYSQKL